MYSTVLSSAAAYASRYTGSSWGHLLNAALDLGRQATEEELDAHPRRMAPTDRVASRELPDSYEGLPDLLVWDHVDKSDKWRGLAHNLGNATVLYDTKNMVYMGSRRCAAP